jgi:hypothetical protein
MLRAFVAALALAVGTGGNAPAPVGPPESEKVPRSVLGIFWNETGLVKPRLVRLDSLTLDPLGRRVPLRLGGGSATAYSPNGWMLAVGTSAPGIQVIDLRRMQEVAFVKVGGSGWVTQLFWQPDLLYAVVEGDRRSSLVLLDPVGWDVLRRDTLAGAVLGAGVGSDQRTGQVVLLTAPRRHIGPVTITVAGAKGSDSAVVSAISGGSQAENGADGYHARQVTPGLALDRAGSRAFVVPARRAVAEVSLDNLAIRYHALSEPVSLLRRLRNWIEPSAEAKLIEGPQRKAAWLGDGLVAVTGADYSTEQDTNGQPHVHVRAAGVSLIDTHAWSIRRVDDESSDFSLFDSTLLAFGDTSWGDPAKKGIGLAGYDLRGHQLFHLFGDTRVSWVETVGGLVYVPLNRERRAVVDAATGRVYGRTKRAKPLSLVAA